MLILLVAVGLVAACSSSPAESARYESVFDMREAVESGGFECSAWEVRGTNQFATESADCTNSVVFGIYPSASAIVDQREVRLALWSIVEDTYTDLTGPNWYVGCGDLEECEELQGLLGGEVKTWDTDSD